ncbi:Chromatin assembly factor 1, subunit A [Terramyces sp. JEL0728]|nr:Chromatin assembly factor 1, subunit A [Terramyces sp. JEL0728]
MQVDIPHQPDDIMAVQDPSDKENQESKSNEIEPDSKTPKKKTKNKKSWFKRGKLDFNQKPLDLEKEPFAINLLASFYQNKLDSLDLLLVLLVQESSETLDQLTKRLYKQFKIQDVKEKLEAIVNYGNDTFPLIKWEASDNMLEQMPIDLKDLLFDRRYERQDLQKEFAAYFESIPKEEMESLTRKRKESLGSNKRVKLDENTEKSTEKELKLQQKLEKEKLRETQKQEKEALRLEKEAQKEALRLEKEAQKQEKLVKKQKIDKSQTNILGFFKPTAKPVQPTNTTIAPVNRFKNQIKEYELTEIAVDQVKEEFEKFKNVKLVKGTFVYPKNSDHHYKLLRFHSDLRPAYFGTWGRKSRVVKGKNPFGKDESLDYEVESELEWEEEEEGEELVSENEEEPEEDDEMEDDWIVPNGYLSDDEGMGKDDEKVKIDKDKLKERLKDKNVVRKVVELVPIVEGLYTAGSIMQTLKFELLDIIEVKSTTTPRKQVFPEELEEDLVKLVLEKEMKLSNLVEYVQGNTETKLTKSCIEVKIKELFKKKGGKWVRKTADDIDAPSKPNTPKDTPSKEKPLKKLVLTDDIGTSKSAVGTPSKLKNSTGNGKETPTRDTTPSKTKPVSAKKDAKFKPLSFFDQPQYILIENPDLKPLFDNCENTDPQNVLRLLLFKAQNAVELGGFKELLSSSEGYDALATGYYDQLKEFLK